MKKTLKFSLLALVITFTIAACDPPQTGSGKTDGGDSLQKDKTATPIDTVQKDSLTTNAAKADSVKK